MYDKIMLRSDLIRLYTMCRSNTELSPAIQNLILKPAHKSRRLEFPAPYFYHNLDFAI